MWKLLYADDLPLAANGKQELHETLEELPDTAEN